MRAFIIGNGPSLDITPMDDLLGEVTFAMNRIHLLWNRRRLLWKPTYYLLFDWTGPTSKQDMIANLPYATCIFRHEKAMTVEEQQYGVGFSWPPRVTYATNCHEHVSSNIDTEVRLPYAWHLPELCGFGSTLGIAIQCAVMMGYDELYLLGCDLGFVPEVEGEPAHNHFDPNYRTYDDFPLEDRDATLIFMHELAKKECGQRGVGIYNATIGGELEVYPRVDLKEVLDGSIIR